MGDDHTALELPDLLLGRRGAVGLLSAFAIAALVREARAAAPRRGTAAAWIDMQQGLAEDLAAGRIAGPQWAAGVERLAAETDLAELVTLARRAVDKTIFRGAANDPAKRFVRFLDGEGRPRRLSYGTAWFDFSPANVITPHGHRHMVSAHLVVGGRLRVRTFDRLADRDGAMLLRPRSDSVAGVGQVSTMCSERGNVHWFVPQGGAAATFDVIVSGLDRGAPDHLIEAVDPLAGRRLADGTLLAPLIDFEAASRRYTTKV